MVGDVQTEGEQVKQCRVKPGQPYAHPLFCREQQVTRSLESYRSLWASVLMQAMKDLVRESAPKESSGARKSNETQRERAAAWFFRPSDPADVGSFSWICEALGLNPEIIRKQAMVRMRQGGRQRFGLVGAARRVVGT